MYINVAKANQDPIRHHDQAPIGQPGQGPIKLAWRTCLASEQFIFPGRDPDFKWENGLPIQNSTWHISHF